MHFAEGNHLWESFFLQRDAFRRRKSSLGELFSAEGCISQKEIISGRVFSCIGMHFAEGNHPCYEVTIVKRRFQEISVSVQATFVFLWQRLERALI